MISGWNTLRLAQARIRPKEHAATPATRYRQAIVRVLRTLRRLASVRRIGSAVWRRWYGNGKSLRALAELDDDRLSNLSETGQRLRREVRRRAQHGW